MYPAQAVYVTNIYCAIEFEMTWCEAYLCSLQHALRLRWSLFRASQQLFHLKMGVKLAAGHGWSSVI